MEIKRVQITRDTSYRWVAPPYKPGETYFVAAYLEGTFLQHVEEYQAVDYPFFIPFGDTTVLTDPWSRFLCALKELQVHAGAAASEYIKPIAEVLRKWEK